MVEKCRQKRSRNRTSLHPSSVSSSLRSPTHFIPFTVDRLPSLSFLPFRLPPSNPLHLTLSLPVYSFSISLLHLLPSLALLPPPNISLLSCLCSFRSISAPSPGASSAQSAPSVLLHSPLPSSASVQREGDPPTRALSYVMRSSGD